MNINELRAGFYRINRRAFSGWSDAKGNIWTTDDIAREVMPQPPPPNEHGLCMVAFAVPALVIGDRVEFAKDLDLFPLDYVERGESGVVVRACRVSGCVEVFLSRHHKRLSDASNCLVIEPHTMDAVLGALVVATTSKRHHVRELMDLAMSG